jgi:hypothetical protein
VSCVRSSFHKTWQRWPGIAGCSFMPVLEGAGLHRLRKNSGPGKKDVPQGYLRGSKPDVFSIIYGPTKVVP